MIDEVTLLQSALPETALPVEYVPHLREPVPVRWKAGTGGISDRAGVRGGGIGLVGVRLFRSDLSGYPPY